MSDGYQALLSTLKITILTVKHSTGSIILGRHFFISGNWETGRDWWKDGLSQIQKKNKFQFTGFRLA